jgi:S1-C subfamily serine protease
MRGFLVAVLLAALTTSPSTAAESPPTPSTADRIYAASGPSLVQIRTLIEGTDKRSSIGSGFRVSADGLAITNYHVVSEFALAPTDHRLEYATTDGGKGTVALVAIDVLHDLALVRLTGGAATFLSFDDRILDHGITKGERLFSMGDPLDLGLTVIEGTYSGLVEHRYTQQIHFSGAVNPGMSGGPAVGADGRVIGVNVSRQLRGELVSFLVPGQFAATLLAAHRDDPVPAPKTWIGEIGRQLQSAQNGIAAALLAGSFRDISIGPYRVPESDLPWVTCWAGTNQEQIPKPRAIVGTSTCTNGTDLFVGDNVTTGEITLSRYHVTSAELSALQFASYLGGFMVRASFTTLPPKWRGPARCTEDFLTPEAGGPPLRASWCARAYRDFPGLYDMTLLTFTEDAGTEALVTQINLRGLSYENGIAIARRLDRVMR